MSGKKELNAINKKIKAIFKKHKVHPAPGEEGFYNAVRIIRQRKSKSDAKKLEKLADHWAVAMSFMLGR
jgi:hypothetical protein